MKAALILTMAMVGHHPAIEHDIRTNLVVGQSFRPPKAEFVKVTAAMSRTKEGRKELHEAMQPYKECRDRCL